ncbi:MAG TPA: tripartite tricarboxylate transporter substrate binding protein [Bradyrhizobium sp.]|jgi:tripartite-type tricarboxylate transporter receptor subunit TctC|uniref:Bug family tripartite tricarboxylate transporter substrate binding protein n=1 Tax=Bradyrhizobium sp. TaxID=376 RepID=UPI002CA1DA72|nr:tripartite tricarboxylate transporter substrate binding protein [Bradyrhizobium sp.]HXB81089.1 tripartite tricarboxylate transporter substrate binding protein [Bradyrhizobium sp.]
MRHAMRWTIILGLFFAAAAAWAENWPSRLIKATIPFGAGSAADVVPRVVFDRLSAELGQAIVVENRPGAGGTLGTAAVVKAEPDGYSVLAQSSALAISPAIYPKLNFDVTKDLASALMIGVSANVMIVPVTRPWKTVQDFITDARAKPGSIVFGSVGIGSATHISAEKFRLAAGIETTHVPYRGGAEVVADILGGRVDFYFCPLATALPLIREGRAHALVVSTPKRVAELPDVPTPAEAGLKNAESVFWLGVFMPAKTPRDVVEKFHAAGAKLLAEPSMQESLSRLGIEPKPMTPQEMDAFVARETAENLEVVRAAGIKP